ncbi:MAG: hypothetical protein DHS20C21_01290 [Gemmatimonadota bacterium]|nr:MAG: hypothetical protein DHS20C21_01290 [Gemmatimonadota bacterium]
MSSSQAELERSDSVQDLAKLLVSLSSGVLAFSVTFAEKVSVGVGLAVALLYAAWILLVLALMFGVKALSRLADARLKGTQTWFPQVLPSLRTCWRAFQAGLIALMLYGALASGIHAWRSDDAPSGLPPCSSACSVSGGLPPDEGSPCGEAGEEKHPGLHGS